MKRIILSGILAILSFSLIAQPGTFKNVTKKQVNKPPVIGIRGFAKGRTSSKGLRSGFTLPGSLNFPGIPSEKNNIDKIILRDNSPVYFERKSNTAKSSLLSDEERFFSFFEDLRGTTGISDPRQDLSVSGITRDEFGITHVDGFQEYKGVKIYGSEFSLHLSSLNERFTGRIYNIDKEINTTPLYSPDEIINVVNSDIKNTTLYKVLSTREKEILHYDRPVCELIILKEKDSFKLAYKVSVRPNFIEIWKYFIDARTGEIIQKFNATCSDGATTAQAVDLNGISRTINTYLEAGKYYLMDVIEPMFNAATQEGVIMTLNANNTSTSDLDYNIVTSTNNSWNNPASVSAHYNATTTYRAFYNLFGRNSINGKGGNIISFINVAEDDGTSMENAFWNGQAVFYGNGGSNFKPLAGALDVAAHELGHGIVSSTSNLEYYSQSGAINETYADIFGSTVDSLDWYIGEDITKTTFSPSGALRNMADPHNLGTSNDPYWQPKHVTEMYMGQNDNGGVHINNGIGNHAYYLFASSVSSRKKAARIFFRALTTYLKSTSQFIDFRIAVIQSATDMYGAGSPEATKAAQAFDAVGIYEEEPVNKEQDYEVNSGTEFLLSYNTNTSSNPNTLYRSSPSATGFQALTTTPMKRKASVTDDGIYIVFVDTDSKIRGISLDPADPGEFFISTDAYWDNVAISKDGNRVAAISIDIDTAIYVFDMTKNPAPFKKFRLYNPTTSHSNTTAGGVLYADAIEFDITGENLIYDAFNVLNSSTEEDIKYWDIGFINVWDNQKNSFGTGAISKLYGSLPENVSIGNPVFSKNSPYIIAFDYLDESNDEYAILGVNLSTGDLGIITYNTIIGFPSFSVQDDKIAYSALSTNDEEVVAVIALNSDKINGQGDAVGLIKYAKWPVYYATGKRELELEPVANFTADYKAGNAPFTVRFLDLSTNDPTTWNWTFEGGTPATSTEKNPVVVFNSPGTFNVTLKASKGSLSNTAVKTDFITVTSATSVNDPTIKGPSFYPNPAKDMIQIQSDSDLAVRIFNINGNLLLQAENRNIIDLTSLTPGVYVIEIETKGMTYRKKLIRE